MARSSYYFELDDMIGRIPEDERVVALDDNADGIEDSAIATQAREDACNAVDIFYNMRGIATPVNPEVYPLSKQASIELAIELLYTRRGEPATRNPRFKIADQMHKLLEKLGAGQLPRGGAVVPAGTGTESPTMVPGDVVDAESEDAMTYAGNGKLLS